MTILGLTRFTAIQFTAEHWRGIRTCAVNYNKVPRRKKTTGSGRRRLHLRLITEQNVALQSCQELEFFAGVRIYCNAANLYCFTVVLFHQTCKAHNCDSTATFSVATDTFLRLTRFCTTRPLQSGERLATF